MPTSKSWKEIGQSADQSRDRRDSNATIAGLASKTDVSPSTTSEMKDTATLPVIQVRKQSISTTSSNSNLQLPDIKSRRGSRKSSISQQDPQSSISPLDGRRSSKRPSFAKFDRRVSNIVGMTKFLTKSIDSKLEENPMEKIEDLPKEPRFSAMLSDEAQFATLKGYEDVLHGHLEINYPDYKTFLNRNKTPAFPVRRKKSAAMRQKAAVQQTTKPSSEEVDAVPVESPDAQTPSEDEPDDEDDIWLPELRQNPRRHSNLTLQTSTSAQIIPPPGNMKKARSLPFVSRGKGRLVMTYRLESAMDILDSIRKTLGQASISPRLKTKKITPLRDYNFWSAIWSREFIPSA